MSEIEEFQKFHPRAVKLLRKKKNFLVIAVDEPYFLAIYALIRAFEIAKGTWSTGDEVLYIRAADQHVQATPAGGALEAPTESGLHNCFACGEENCTEKNKIYFCDECSKPLSDAELSELGLSPRQTAGCARRSSVGRTSPKTR